MNKLALLIAAIAPLSAQLSAQTNLTLLADRDATLYESATGDLANGGGNGLFIGVTGQPKVRRALVRFDLSGIPAGSRILSATLTTNSTASASASPLVTDWHRVLVDWSEGTTVAPGNGGGGGTAQSGDVTWLHRDYPQVSWSNAGGDFAATPSFSMPIQPAGLSGSGFQQGLVDDLQAWLDNPAGNFGWLIKSDESTSSTATKIDSRETGGGVQLSVSLLVPGAVGQWGVGCPVNGLPMTLSLTGPATSGSTVGLDYQHAPTSSIGATFFALELGYGPAGIGIPLFPPTCSAYLPLNAIVPGNLWTTNAQGVASDTFAIPANSPGFLVVCQGAAIDATPIGVSASNAGVMLTQ
ncbi:MAG: DNRLRE domain-containing protein [Planctomycetes bacterium]|nr:DNRLRE domain-containing protein [Planctomycetota bacterium]